MAPSTSPVPATSPLPRTLSGRQAGRVLKPGKEAPGSRSAFRVCACSGRSNTCSSLSGLRRGDQQRPPAERRAASASSRRVLPPPEGRGRGGRGRPEPRARPAGPAAAGTRAPLGGELGGRGFTARSAARLRPPPPPKPRPPSLGARRWRGQESRAYLRRCCSSGAVSKKDPSCGVYPPLQPQGLGKTCHYLG